MRLMTEEETLEWFNAVKDVSVRELQPPEGAVIVIALASPEAMLPQGVAFSIGVISSVDTAAITAGVLRGAFAKVASQDPDAFVTRPPTQ